jgi:phosphatidylinositol alpha-1,6-mannosyltransferase
MLRKSLPQVLYAIVGGGDELAYLQDLTRRHGVEEHVQFLGEVDDAELLACYQDCDLFALANRSIGNDVEGFGMVLVEAQACAKPVLAGISGGTRDTLIQNQTGILADCETASSIADAIATTFGGQDECKRMGIAGREHVCRTFDWDALATQAANLFNSLARQHS